MVRVLVDSKKEGITERGWGENDRKLGVNR